MATDLVTQLEYDRYERDDPFPDWRDTKPFEPMLAALLLEELEDASDGCPAVSWLPSPRGERIAVKSGPYMPAARGITGQAPDFCTNELPE